ncbi:hypothetical protein BGW80DRAFT_127198 [Lactifluus volemus]|nr:hypothetical protein BGW80DRAFT_127198 [Lactifluus volemus]
MLASSLRGPRHSVELHSCLLTGADDPRNDTVLTLPVSRSYNILTANASRAAQRNNLRGVQDNEHLMRTSRKIGNDGHPEASQPLYAQENLHQSMPPRTLMGHLRHMHFPLFATNTTHTFESFASATPKPSSLLGGVII